MNLAHPAATTQSSRVSGALWSVDEAARCGARELRAAGGECFVAARPGARGSERPGEARGSHAAVREAAWINLMRSGAFQKKNSTVEYGIACNRTAITDCSRAET